MTFYADLPEFGVLPGHVTPPDVTAGTEFFKCKPLDTMQKVPWDRYWRAIKTGIIKM